MKKPLSLLAALCLGVMLAFGTASAAPITSYYYTNTLSQSVTNNIYGSQVFTFDQFNVLDGAKGPGQYMDLLGITVSVDYSYLIGETVVGNTSTNPSSQLRVTGYNSKFGVQNNSLGYTAFTNAIATVETSPPWQQTATDGIGFNQSRTFTLSPNQYFVDPGLAMSQSIANTFFSAYTGPGTINFLLNNDQEITTTGGRFDGNTEGAGALTSMTVTYTYGVPEPSTYALMSLGALALVIAYRRKRAA
jgi:hypothetical protein